MTDHPTAPATWDDVVTEAFRVTVDRTARGVASQDERTLLRQHTELLLAELARTRRELADRDEAESADAAAGSYAGRAEGVETKLRRVAALADRWGKRTDQLRVAADHIRAALAHNDYAIAQPEPWLHIAFTSPDETTANTSALALRDHLAAEFSGVGMRITTNAAEPAPADECDHDSQVIDHEGVQYWACLKCGRNHGRVDAPSCSPGVEETEPNNPAATDIETTARVLAALHRSAEDTVTRVIDLYEQWVKAGAPPLGVPTARWWDRRLVELHDTINPPAEQPARTTANNAPASSDNTHTTTKEQ